MDPRQSCLRVDYYQEPAHHFNNPTQPNTMNMTQQYPTKSIICSVTVQTVHVISTEFNTI